MNRHGDRLSLGMNVTSPVARLAFFNRLCTWLLEHDKATSLINIDQANHANKTQAWNELDMHVITLLS